MMRHAATVVVPPVMRVHVVNDVEPIIERLVELGLKLREVFAIDRMERPEGEAVTVPLRIGQSATNMDGRITDLLDGPLDVGWYRITFDTGAYFKERGVPCFFPEVAILFEVKDASQHHHVPLLLSPFGYSTYRGT